MSLVHPLLAWGLGLVGVPILIHLLARRRFQVVRWAAMDLLLQAHKHNRRRIRLEHLLVLLLRCLAVALVVLAVARPVSTSGALALLPGAGEAIERVVLLDDSGSMGHRTGRTRAWDRARDAVRRLADDLRRDRPGDPLTLVRASRPDVPDLYLTPAGNERVDVALRALEQQGPTALSLDAPRLLGEAVRRLQAEKDAPGRRVVYVVTDLRRGDWLGADGQVPRAVAAALRAAPPETRVLFADAGGDDAANLSLTALEAAEPLVTAGVPVELVVRLANRGAAPVFDVPLVLEAGEARVPLPPVARVDARGEVEVRHPFTFPAAGSRAVVVRCPEDALPLDDARALALEVRDVVRTLLVDGAPGLGPLDGEAGMLRMALAPGGDLQTGVDAAIVGPDALREVELAPFQAVIACDLEGWPDARAGELARWVERGGGLALFLGDRTDPAAWARALGPGSAAGGAGGLLPAGIGRREVLPAGGGDGGGRGLLAPEAGHPLVSVFLGERNPFLARVRARAWFALAPAPEATVVLRLDDAERTPFVVERTVGLGRVVVFNTSADLEASSWARDPSFPVTAHELVRRLTPPSAAGRNLAAGAPIVRRINPARVAPQAQLVRPAPPGGAPADAGPRAPDELTAAPLPGGPGPGDGGDALAFTIDDTRAPGVYRLQLAPRAGEPVVEAFAVNPRPEEGDLARADPAQLVAALEGVTAQVVSADDAAGLLARSDGARAELWRTLLIALLVALGLESVLAWRAAHHRTDGGAGDGPDEGPGAGPAGGAA